MNLQNEWAIEGLTGVQLDYLIYGKLHSGTRWGYCYEGIRLMSGVGNKLTNSVHMETLRGLGRETKVEIAKELFN